MFKILDFIGNMLIGLIILTWDICSFIVRMIIVLFILAILLIPCTLHDYGAGSIEARKWLFNIIAEIIEC